MTECKYCGGVECYDEYADEISYHAKTACETVKAKLGLLAATDPD